MILGCDTMDIDIKDVVELDDNIEYIVVSKTNYNNNTYYYLIDINNTTNFKFLYEDLSDQTLVEVEYDNLLKELVPLFLSASKPVLEEMNIEGIKN